MSTLPTKPDDQIKLVRKKKKRKPGDLTERQQQIRLFSWIDKASALQLETIKRLGLSWVHSSGNGEHKSMVARMLAKKSGQRKGVHDVFAVYPAHGNHGAYFELKIGKNKMSEEQVAFRLYLEMIGYKTHDAFYTWQSAAKAIVEYFSLEPGTYPEII